VTTGTFGSTYSFDDFGLYGGAQYTWTENRTYPGLKGKGISMSVRMNATSGTRTVRMGLYNTSLHLLAATQYITVDTTYQVWTANFSPQPALTTQSYWLALSSSQQFHAAASTSGVARLYDIFTDLPDPVVWSSVGGALGFYIYCTVDTTPVPGPGGGNFNALKARGLLSEHWQRLKSGLWLPTPAEPRRIWVIPSLKGV
jgi:hypothetical protein